MNHACPVVQVAFIAGRGTLGLFWEFLGGIWGVAVVREAQLRIRPMLEKSDRKCISSVVSD
jgi:hypothetical protein